MNKKKTAIGAGIAAMIATLALTVFNNETMINLEGTYNIVDNNSYSSELKIEIPEEFSADIYELRLNDGEIKKALLPGGTITTLPIVTSNVENLSIIFYARGAKVGVGAFSDDNRLIIKAVEDYVAQ